jgi:acetolactate synthase-1/2/3 large subunit
MFNPDFCRIADAYGIPSFRIRTRDEVAPAVRAARALEEGPALLEFVVEKEDIVYPMVPSGARLDDMIRRPIE